jgi:hypothetical protein
LRAIRKDLPQAERDIPARLQRIAAEDSDNDGVPNELEILLGRNPGDPRTSPTSKSAKQGAPAPRSSRSSWHPTAGSRLKL